MTFPERIRAIRLAQGLTIKAAAQATGVATNTFSGWEAGLHTPKLWRAGDIAKALNVPVAALFTDELVIADVVVSQQTISAIRTGGREECERVAERLVAQLEPLLWAAVTAKPPRPRRRKRVEKLAGIRAAQAAAKARAAKPPPPITS